jgi:hypothetical protein
LFELTVATTQRTYARLGYENLKTQATEKLHSYETLNDFLIYMRTSDPEKKEKLVKQGRVRSRPNVSCACACGACADAMIHSH